MASVQVAGHAGDVISFEPDEAGEGEDEDFVEGGVGFIGDRMVGGGAVAAVHESSHPVNC